MKMDQGTGDKRAYNGVSEYRFSLLHDEGRAGT